MSTLIKNMVLSISWVGLFLVAYTVYEMGLPNSFSDLLGYLTLFLMFLAFYLVFSIFGWILFGLPIHWAIKKWASKDVFYYPIAGLGFFLLILVLNSLELAVLLGGAAILQASIFAYLTGRGD